MSGNITLVYTTSSAKLFQDFNLTEGRHSETSSRLRFATFYFRKKIIFFIMSKNIMTFYAIFKHTRFNKICNNCLTSGVESI
jgi:hypothetical protein